MGWKTSLELPAGLLKETLRSPPALDKLPPFDGDEVQLHFTIKSLAGTVLDGSWDRSSTEAPYVYKVGEPGLLFEGFALAVKTLRRGESARFTIPSRFAYGDDGNKAIGVGGGETLVLELELVSCPAREDLFDDDGGVVKLQNIEGSSRARMPRKNDDIQVSYKVLARSAGQDGEDTVVMEAEHKVYRCGTALFGTLGKSIDKALLSMKRGDAVTLTCQPRHAFAGAQSEHSSKVAIVHLALEEIHEVYDTSLGLLDGTVLRKRIKEGPAETPKIVDGCTVTLRVKGVVANGVEVSSQVADVSFQAGTGEVCDALEGAVIGLRVGDEAVLRCQSKESCAGSLLNLPDDATIPIMVHIEILSTTEGKDKWDMSTAERIMRGKECKEVAGQLFKSGRTRLAAQHYERIADFFAKPEFIADEQERAAALELRRVSRLNASMCMLKLGQYPLVKELCTQVLKEDPCNAKAYFRRGKALLELKEYEDAVADFLRLLELEPTSSDGRAGLREAKRRSKEVDRGSQFAFSKMISALNEFPERSAGRSQSDVVVAPNIDEEWAKLAKETGITFRTSSPALPATAPAETFQTSQSRQDGQGGQDQDQDLSETRDPLEQPAKVSD